MDYGVCYYPEHWPESRWPEDARLMRAAGLTLVRLAEFAWAKLEPAAETFDWSWLDRAIDILQAEGHQIVLGTPTATPPAWLCHAHPDILPVDAEGRRRRFGSRRHYCPTSPTYRTHVTRIVTAMAERYGQHPAVTAWQIDNEFGDHNTARCYCDHCAAAFRTWLQARYHTLDTLNTAWGTVFWSQTYSDWSQISPPNLTVTEPNPSHTLDYYRFASDSFVTFQQLQIDILRQHALGRPLTTNLLGPFPDLDYHRLCAALDFVSWDSYPTGYSEVHATALYSPNEPRPAVAYDTGDPYVIGFCHDLTYGLKRAPFWIMEQQCGNINWSQTNTGIRPGTMRLWVWHAALHGADKIVYFRWRATHYAQEQYHSGLRHHDGAAALGYTELASLHADQAALQASTGQAVPAPVALLLDYEDGWALKQQPHGKDFGYLRQLFLYYRVLAWLGVPVAIVSPDSDLTRHKLVVAHTSLMADSERAAHFSNYVRQGGRLLLGVRSGFKTPNSTVTDGRLPGAFRALAGAVVTQWHALPPGIAYPLHSDGPPLTDLSAATWAEALTLNSPDAVAHAHYTAGPFAGSAALTEHRVGAGRCFYLGWYPTLTQATDLLRWLGGAAGIDMPTELLPEGVVVGWRGPTQALLNFTDSPHTVTWQGQVYVVAPRDVTTLPTTK